MVPLSILRHASIGILSCSLNGTKIIPSDDGLPRDWRGLAVLMELNQTQTIAIGHSKNPTAELFNVHGSTTTVHDLQQYLRKIDRFDVLEDSKELIEKDVKAFLERPSGAVESRVLSNVADSVAITFDDIKRLEKGLEPQIYDAYLLFAEEETDFALEILKTMEKEDLKFCYRDRDLLPGIAFQHEAIMRLIAERCRRLLVVVSPLFLKSSTNFKFFVTFAQALGIETRQRKVIPIMYKKCPNLPPELSYYFHCDYTRLGELGNFWDKLKESIRMPDIRPDTIGYGSDWISRLPPQLSITNGPQQSIDVEAAGADDKPEEVKKKKIRFKKLFSKVGIGKKKEDALCA